MGLIWVILGWLVAMILYYGWKWRKKKQEKITISQEAIRSYEGKHRK